MPSKVFIGTKSPSDELSLTNRVIINPVDCDVKKTSHAYIQPNDGTKFLFTLQPDRSMAAGSLGFSLCQRKWAGIMLGAQVTLEPFTFDPRTETISQVTLKAAFLVKKSATTDAYDTDGMANSFLMQFPRQSLVVGQQLSFKFADRKYLLLTVTDIQVLRLDKSGGTVTGGFSSIGELTPNSVIIFEKEEDSPLNLVGKSKVKGTYKSIIDPDWDFSKMGIGGLDKEFSMIFRRAFSSRIFPPEVNEQLGNKHVRGMLLYGPPGTGKTLMARQIGKMLNAREPKIVNGPSILDKYVGESEANIRKLFADAEEEEKKMGPNSGLHIIIFDEIDAICKSRGSMAGSTAVHDTVVNQLLSKIDGVESLNNILIIGMTNRKDLIDEALLRPGRLEVQMEINLPDEHGRLQILQIHTAKMRRCNRLAPDVNIELLAKKAKNFSGAELEGLVRAATSTAMYRRIQFDGKVDVNPEDLENLVVTREDFMNALGNDVKAAFGSNEEDFTLAIANGIINWGDSVSNLLENGAMLIEELKCSSRVNLVTVLLEGPIDSGKTALAARIVQEGEFPFVKVFSAEQTVAFHENARCQVLKKVFDDAHKSPFSCVIVEDVERILNYVPIGPHFSNTVLQALMVFLRKKPPHNRKLMVVATTSSLHVLQQMELTKVFDRVLHVSNISSPVELMSALKQLDTNFTSSDFAEIDRELSGRELWLGIKRLIHIVEAVKVCDQAVRVSKFISLLEELGGLQLQHFQ